MMLKVDVSEQDQAVELKGIISDQTGLDYAGFTYKHQDSGKTKSFYVYQRNTTKLSEGTEEFSLLVELPKGTNPGIWKLYSVSTQDKLDNRKSIYADSNIEWSDEKLTELAELGITNPENLAIEISSSDDNTTTDQEAPVFREFSINKDKFDLSEQNQPLTFSGAISDATGFKSASLGFKNQQTDKTQYFYIGERVSKATSSEDNQIVSEFTAVNQIHHGFGNGVWNLSYLSIRDKSDNNIYAYASSDGSWTNDNATKLQKIGIDPELHFEVTGAPVDSDQDAPVVESITLANRTIDLSTEDQALEISGTVSDATGFDYISLAFKNHSEENSQRQYFYIYNRDASISDLNKPNAVDFSKVGSLPKGLTNGTWKLDYFNIEDQIDNRTYANAENDGTWSSNNLKKLKDHGIDPNNLSFEITGSPEEGDSQAPSFESLEIVQPVIDTQETKPTLNIDEGQRVLDFTFAVKDSGSGLGNYRANTAADSNVQVGYARFTSTTGQNFYTYIRKDDLIAGDLNNGVFKTSKKFNGNLEDGKWSLSSLYLYDQKNNQLSIPWELQASTDTAIVIHNLYMTPKSLSAQLI